MFKTARDARENAYAPYSGFKVGASVKTVDGTIFGGCNVENVAYPEGTCAEAGAIAAMVAAGYTEVTEVMVVTDTEVPVTPCGGCRQKLAEFCKPGVPITLANLEGPLKTMTLSELIPGVFDREQMGTG